ncbi:MAG: two-component regulator propeller domain-containing protein [Massilia sp.]
MQLRLLLLPLLLLLFLCAHSPAALASNAGGHEKSLTQYKLDSWQTEQGLPQNAVTALLQASDGYLWIGTLGGLARFDGVRFTTFDASEFADIASHPVVGLMQDSHKNLWIGHNKGAAIYLNGKFKPAFAAPANVDQRVWAFAEGADGVVWAATNNGLARWQNRFYHVTDGLPTERLRALTFDRDGVLWIATSGGGLVTYTAGQFRVFNPDNGFPHLEVRAVLADPAGGIWAATAGGGLVRVQRDKIKVYTVADGLPTDQLTGLARDSHGRLWIGTWGGGVSLMSGERFTALSSANGLAGDHVWSLHTDNQGEVWVGTWVNGLVRMRERAFGWIGVPEGLSHDNVRSVLYGRNGVTWVATSGGGLNRIDGAGITKLGQQQGLPSDEISGLLEDPDGALWIGTYTGGAARLAQGRVSTYGVDAGLPSAEVRMLFRDRQGQLWAGTAAGLARFTGHGFAPVHADGAPTGGVTAIAQDRHGTLWFGTAGEGLVRYRDGVFKALTRSDGMLSNWIMSLYEDKAGGLWVGTNGDGVNRLRDDRVSAIWPADGLWDGTCLSILEDRRGYLWFTTNRGFFRVARAELDGFAEGRIGKVVSTAFGAAESMRSTTFAGGLQPASAMHDAGRLLLPTTRGLVVVDPDKLPGAGLAPPVRLEKVSVNGVSQDAAAAMSLPPGPATVSIQYSAMTLLHAERMRYRYQMQGLTPTWIDTGLNREVSFPALSHGSYRFRVVSSLDGQHWSEAGPGLAIEVAPYFHQTAWFKLLLADATLAALMALYRLRLHQLRARHAEMERQMAQKTEALRLADEHLSRLSFLDALTGLANRRRFDEVLAEEWNRACRSGEPLALILADIDSFKRNNDALGHPEGDRCIAAVAAVFMSHARRAADLAARYGGEEFVLVLPGAGRDAAMLVAEAIRSACETLAIIHPNSRVAPVVTLSLGVAVCVPSNALAMASLIEGADAALYQAKHEGRNRVCLQEHANELVPA